MPQTLPTHPTTHKQKITTVADASRFRINLPRER